MPSQRKPRFDLTELVPSNWSAVLSDGKEYVFPGGLTGHQTAVLARIQQLQDKLDEVDPADSEELYLEFVTQVEDFLTELLQQTNKDVELPSLTVLESIVLLTRLAYEYSVGMEGFLERMGKALSDLQTEPETTSKPLSKSTKSPSKTKKPSSKPSDE